MCGHLSQVLVIQTLLSVSNTDPHKGGKESKTKHKSPAWVKSPGKNAKSLFGSPVHLFSETLSHVSEAKTFSEIFVDLGPDQIILQGSQHFGQEVL